MEICLNKVTKALINAFLFAEVGIINENHIFVLDVGTRKVTGLLAAGTAGEEFTVKCAYKEEHESRSMLDGQIHDVPKVAKVIEKVKQKIEEEAGVTLTKACVAAAGRSLKTETKKIEKDIPALELTEEDVLKLEYEALYASQGELHSKQYREKNPYSTSFHCVGYSVQNYFLDGYEIKNLVGQKGRRIGVQVIATFLPRVVLDSLRSALKRAGLELESLTLEPIAALNMVVSSDTRRLNLALVDVGAGTSDIAITADGSVLNFDMVPVAGDEITEILCNDLLLDFQEAEKIKRSLLKEKEINITDILGNKKTLPSGEIKILLTPGTESLAAKIAACILKGNNGHPPAGIFCVGGGSLTPGLTNMLAAKTGLKTGRVAVKGKKFLKLLPEGVTGFQGPDLVTPLGIARCALDKVTLKFSQVFLNGEAVQVPDLNRITILDVLLAAGVLPSQLYGRSGEGLTVQINDSVKAVPGEKGRMARVLLENREVSLDKEVAPGDQITFEPSTRGETVQKAARSILPAEMYLHLTVNGEKRHLPPYLLLNGLEVLDTVVLKNGDKLLARPLSTVGEVVYYLKQKIEEEWTACNLLVNGKLNTVKVYQGTVKLNGQEADLSSPVKGGDFLECNQREEGQALLRDLLFWLGQEKVPLSVNGEELELSSYDIEITKGGQKTSPAAFFTPADSVAMTKKKKNLIMADVLKEIKLKTIKPNPSSKLILKLNGQNARFSSPVKKGDIVEAFWS